MKKVRLLFAWLTFPITFIALVCAWLAVSFDKGYFVDFTEGFRFLYFGRER